MLYRERQRVYVTDRTHGHGLVIGNIYTIDSCNDVNYRINDGHGTIWSVMDSELEPAGEVGDSGVIVTSPNSQLHNYEVGTRVIVRIVRGNGGFRVCDSNDHLQFINREDIQIILTTQNQEDMFEVGETVTVIAGHDNHHSFPIGTEVVITSIRGGGGIQAENREGYSQSLYPEHFEKAINTTEVDGVEKFDRFKQNLSKQGNSIISYTTVVAIIDGDKLIEQGKWSQTTSKHVKYAAKELRLELVRFGTVVEMKEEPVVDKKRDMVLTAHRYANHNKAKIKQDFADYFRPIAVGKIDASDLIYHPLDWDYNLQKAHKVVRYLTTDEDRFMDGISDDCDGETFATAGRVYPVLDNGDIYTDRCHNHGLGGHDWCDENFREATPQEVGNYLEEEMKHVCGGEGYKFIGKDNRTIQTVQAGNWVKATASDDGGYWFKVITDRYSEGGIVYEDGKWFTLETREVTDVVEAEELPI